MSNLRPIVDYRIGLFGTWAAVPVKRQDDDWPVEVAARLCDDEQQRNLLAGRLAAAHPDLIGPDEHVGIAVWVPDRGVGEVFGIMFVDWLLPEPGIPLDRPYYLDLIARTKRPKVTVYAQLIDSVDLPAGPAVCERETISVSTGRRFSRREMVQDNIMYTVFPPGSNEALQLTFSTDALDRSVDLAVDAAELAATLEIMLGEPDAAT